MNYSLPAKNEIVKLGFSTDCCKLAFLSAVIHSAGSVFIKDKSLAVEVCSENEKLLAKISGITKEFYGVEPIKTGKTRVAYYDDKAMRIMIDCGIFELSGGHTCVCEGIKPNLVENDCCKVNYVRGVFLGSGSLSTNKGYHLEFGVSNPVFADDLMKLIRSLGVSVKVIVREKKIVVYAQGSDSVCDALALMGAGGAVLKINGELAYRDVRKNYNRINNCEYANIGKTVDAAVKQTEAIKKIYLVSGKETLTDKLFVVAECRLNNPEASLTELSEILALPKSTVKNRLARIIEISDSLKEKTND